jgi:hypothetical protein
MLVVSSKKFRENPRSYFDKIDSGVDILIQRGKSRSYKIVPIKKVEDEEEDDSLMTKEEFFAKIERAAQSIEEGRGVTLHSKEEILAYLESI